MQLTDRDNGQYYYRVRACDAVHTEACGTWLNSTDFTPSFVEVTLPPDPPSSIGVPTSKVTTDSYDISWVGPAGSYFRLYETTSPAFSDSNQPYSGLGTNTTLSDRTSGNYWYWISACHPVNQGWCSAPLGSGSVNVRPRPDVPASIAVPAGPDIDGAYTVSWTGPSGAHFDLFESTLPDYSNGSIVQSDLSLSASISGQANGAYYYRVRACNPTDTSVCSAWLNGPAAGIDVTLPPTGAINVAVPSSYDTDGAYTVSWSGVSGAYFELFEAETAYGAARPQFSASSPVYGGLNSSLPIAGRDDGRYWYWVRACNPENTSSCGSAYASDAVDVTFAPGDMSSLNVPSGMNISGTYTVSWQGPSGSYFRLYEAENEDFQGATPAYSGTNVSTQIAGQGNGTYYYQVKACHPVNTQACGELYSNTQGVQVTLRPPPPAELTVPSGSIQEGTSFTVSWTQQPAVRYELWESVNANFAGQQRVHSGGGLQKVLTRSQGTYYYRIRSCHQDNANACGSYTTAANPATVIGVPSAPPWISTNPPGGFSESGDYWVSWGASSSGGVDRYELYESLNGLSGWTRVHNNSAASKQFNDKPSNNYYYKVRACNAAGCSNYTGNAHMEVERTDGIPNAVDPGPTTDGVSGGTEARVSPRLEALRERQAALEALRVGRAGRTIGGSGSGFRYAVKYHYNSRGLMSEVTEAADPSVFLWRAQSRDAFGHVDSALLGNGITVTETLDRATGEILRIDAFSPSVGQVQDLVYDWDNRRNLIRRKDQIDDLEETIDSLSGYDALGRLKVASVTGGPTLSLNYDAVGNIQNKAVSGSPDPAHDYSIQYDYEVGSDRLDEFRVNGDLVQDVIHDANGSITKRGDVTIQWTPFNKPAMIDKAGEASYFSYGHDRSRYRQDYREPDAETGAMVDAYRLYVQGIFEVVVRATAPSPTEEYHHHVYAEGRVVATHIRRNTQNHTTQWLLRDHLGSIDKVTDENGDELMRQSFDAFGMRRAATWDGPPMLGEVPGARQFTNRGYTGHEMLDHVEMIHMNGRVYDPFLGRFMSADPIVAKPLSSQGWNAYSYVEGNPFAYTDPSGYQAQDVWTIFDGFVAITFGRFASYIGRPRGNPDGNVGGGGSEPTGGGNMDVAGPDPVRYPDFQVTASRSLGPLDAISGPISDTNSEAQAQGEEGGFIAILIAATCAPDLCAPTIADFVGVGVAIVVYFATQHGEFEGSWESPIGSGADFKNPCPEGPDNCDLEPPPYRVAPPHRVVNATADFQSRSYQFGSHTFRLDRSGLKHILQRHHPRYWDGSVKAQQTFFDPRATIPEIENSIGLVLQQNRLTLTSKGTNSIFQIRGVVNGRTYVLGINRGRVGQFFPVK